jgi:hypothetical protein
VGDSASPLRAPGQPHHCQARISPDAQKLLWASRGTVLSIHPDQNLVASPAPVADRRFHHLSALHPRRSIALFVPCRFIGKSSSLIPSVLSLVSISYYSLSLETGPCAPFALIVFTRKYIYHASSPAAHNNDPRSRCCSLDPEVRRQRRFLVHIRDPDRYSSTKRPPPNIHRQLRNLGSSSRGLHIIRSDILREQSRCPAFQWPDEFGFLRELVLDMERSGIVQSRP